MGARMKGVVQLAATAALMSATAASAGQLSATISLQAVPHSIQLQATRMLTQCNVASNQIRTTKFIAIDMNRDGRPDYAMPAGPFPGGDQCEFIGSASFQEVWLSDRNGYKPETWSDTVLYGGPKGFVRGDADCSKYGSLTHQTKAEADAGDMGQQLQAFDKASRTWKPVTGCVGTSAARAWVQAHGY